MAAPSITIADAVVAALNAAALSQSVTFARAYVPKFDTQGSAVIQGLVVPVSDSREASSAADDNATVEIDIGVMKRLQNAVAEELDEIDALMDYCEELRAVVNRQRLGNAADSICTATTQEPLYSVEDVDGKRVFITKIRATFQTTVAA